MEEIKDFEIVELKSGKKVKVIELTGLDEMIAARITGSEMNIAGSGLLQYNMVMRALSIKEIDGKEITRPKNMAEVMELLARFKSKETGKLAEAYNKLNTDLGETQATESKA